MWKIQLPWQLIVFSTCLTIAKAEPPKADRKNENWTSSDDGQHVSIQQAQIPQPSPPSGPRNFGRESIRERLDSVLLVLNRVNDRMVVMDSRQSERTERIDNINYRMTKMELVNEETKGQLSEISNTLRHRMQTTERELERVHSAIEELQNKIGELNLGIKKAATDQTIIRRINENSGSASTLSSDSLQSLMAAIFGIKASNQVIRAGVEDIARNFTVLERSISTVQNLGSSIATKQDMLQSIAGINELIDGIGSHPTRIYSGMQGGAQKTKKALANDCWELLHKRNKKRSGVYKIQPESSIKSFFVYCDMETSGGGWTVFQRRIDGSIDFKRGWNDYKNGFGNIAGEFWMGNNKLHQITNQNVNELHIILADFSQNVKNATYASFLIGDEKEGYAIRMLGEYSGEAGDSFGYHIGQKFSTFDFDNDANPELNCAREHTGAWWYKACDTSNLNGQYLHGPVPPDHQHRGIYWYDYHGPQYSLWQTTMMIRRTESASFNRKNKQPKKIDMDEIYPNDVNQRQIKEELDAFDPDVDPIVIFDYNL